MASLVESSRVIKEKQYYQNLYLNKLPRGPVPPSDASPCHNKLDPFYQSKFSFPPHFILCP
ncbi:hypothetical protein RND71_007531 [Anisodus tanguticus]|uniref:Uncharacterized protein n=1 Tax=Anisodus tanguticus TaxID=243964 RepID=A0AAE1SLR4_9SOLA|nr:hypothetical protein RND71_007531 [Anisodus tanguticus]